MLGSRSRFEKGLDLVPDSVNLDPQHSRHNEICGAADEAVLNEVHFKK